MEDFKNMGNPLGQQPVQGSYKKKDNRFFIGDCGSRYRIFFCRQWYVNGSNVYDSKKIVPSLYCVDYNDGNEECSKTKKTFKKLYEEPGTYTVTYRVEDKGGRFDEFSQKITLEPKAVEPEPEEPKSEPEPEPEQKPEEPEQKPQPAIKAKLSHKSTLIASGLNTDFYNNSTATNTKITAAKWTIRGITYDAIMKNDLNADGTGGDYRKILPYPLGNGGEYGPINVAVKLDVTDGSLSDSISTSIPVTKPLKADFGCTITLAQQAQSSLMQQSSSFSATIVFEDKSKVLVKGVSPITNFSIKIGNAMPLTGKISDLSSIKAKIGALNNNITYEVSNVDNFRDRAEKNMDKCEILQEAQKEVTSETQNIYANFDLITSGRGNNNTTYAMFHDISTSTPEGIIELISWDAGSLTNQIKINQTDKGDYSTMEFPFKAGTDKPYDVDITLTVKSGDIEKTVSKKFNVTGSGLTEVTAQAYKKSKGFGKYLQASVVDASTTQVLGDYVIAEPGATVYFAAGCIAEDASLKIRAMENNQEAQSIVDGAKESDTAMLLINANKTNNANKLCTKPTEVEKIVKVEVPTEVIVERVVEKPK